MGAVALSLHFLFQRCSPLAVEEHHQDQAVVSDVYGGLAQAFVVRHLPRAQEVADALPCP